MPVRWWAVIRSTNRQAEELGHKLGYFKKTAYAVGFGCTQKTANCEKCGGRCRINWMGKEFAVSSEGILDFNCDANKARLEKIRADYLKELRKSKS